MMLANPTRFQAALLGFSLAAASCMLSLATDKRRADAPALELPQVLDSWKLLEQGELDEDETTMLQAHDHWRRVYQCQETKQRVVVTLVTGASGPLVCHQPAVCYALNEYSSYSEPRLWNAPQGNDEFRFQTFEPRDLSRPAMTVCYAWHDGHRWSAPQVPRLRLAGRSSLQRLQISMQHPTGCDTDAQAAIRQFLSAAVDATRASESPISQSQMAAAPSPTTASAQSR